MKISRRDFLKNSLGAGAFGVGGLVLSWPWNLLSAKALENSRKQEKDILVKLVDIILPKTVKTPSASEVKVPLYIQKVMGGEIPRYRWLRKSSFYRKAYERLFLFVEIEAKKVYQKTFLKLSPEEATKVLESLAVDKVSAQVGYRTAGYGKVSGLTAADLVSILRGHTLQGYFAEPTYGGNNNYASWVAIGHICQMNYPGDQASCEE